MADFSGLESAQASAEQVPYKNIALGNPAEKFLNAWALTTGIALKKDEFQGRMAALAVKNHQLELKGELDQAKFGLAMQKADSDATHKGNMYELAAQRLYNQDQVHKLATDKYSDLMDGQTSLLSLHSQAAEHGLSPGDPGYRNFMLSGASSLTGKLPPSVLNKFITGVEKDETGAIQLKQKALAAKTQDFMHTMSNTLYGTQTNTDLYPVQNYQTDSPTLQTEYKPKPWHIPGFGPPETPPEPTGFKLVYQKDATGKILPNPRKVPTQTLADLNKQWQELQQQKASIAPIPVDTGTTYNIRTSDGRQGTLPASAIDEAKKRDPGLVIIP